MKLQGVVYESTWSGTFKINEQSKIAGWQWVLSEVFRFRLECRTACKGGKNSPHLCVHIALHEIQNYPWNAFPRINDKKESFYSFPHFPIIFHPGIYMLSCPGPQKTPFVLRQTCNYLSLGTTFLEFLSQGIISYDALYISGHSARGTSYYFQVLVMVYICYAP